MKPPVLSLGTLAWRLSTCWKAEVDRALAPLGLSHAQHAVLAALLEAGAQRCLPTQQQLAARVGLMPIFVSKLVRALAAAGLVARCPDARDSRAKRLALTERGREVAGRARAEVKVLERRLAAPLGTPGGAKARALAATLGAMIEALANR